MMKPYMLTLLIFVLPFFFIKDAASAPAKVLENPPCTNTVCVSHVMIAVAHNLRVEFDPMPSYFEELSHEVPCIVPRPTGVTVQKQVPKQIVKFADRFCTNQGCFTASDKQGKTICQ